MSKWDSSDWGICICILIALLGIGAVIFIAISNPPPPSVYEVKAEIKDNRVYTQCPTCKHKLLLTGVKESDKTTDL